MSDYDRLRVYVAAENAAERRRLARGVRRELDSLYAAQATEAYGRSGSGSGGTSFRETPAREEDDFAERWNDWRLADGERPSNSEVDAYVFRRGVEKLYPQIQRLAVMKYGLDSPYRRGEP